MNRLSFGWKGHESLPGELARPLTRVSIGFAFHGRPDHVALWKADETGLLVHSEMHDVADRREVGVLRFSRVFATEAQEIMIEASSEKVSGKVSGTDSSTPIQMKLNSQATLLRLRNSQVLGAVVGYDSCDSSDL